MNEIYKVGILIFLFSLSYSCSNQRKSNGNKQEVMPWCIVTFDSLQRSPAARIDMLKEMGFTNYGYEGQGKYLDDMLEEFQLAHENSIEISSVFLWLNAKRDSMGKLSPSNKRMFDILSQVEQKPCIWLSFSNNYFKGLSQEQSLNLAVEFIQFIKTKAAKIGCKVALYNHHGWFGNPYNQLEIIEKLANDSLKMVYNFHHAHSYIDEFPEIVKKIKPHLSHVNINGMKNDGHEILTVGEGDDEYDMMKVLLEEGYTGSWGILGHMEHEDVQKVLERNIVGFNKLKSKYQMESNN
ncbi:sugar phosphate isomerase/epimerase family protein [Labilibacter marinus]|uniref:sugar phosphate isomerase/epimerase family protein n=1 Tax=Labilibacter marinus TaxID=1477105 RepID=UPI00094FA47E|nr:TIM barrel protein [Labilibacter marinus]